MASVRYFEQCLDKFSSESDLNSIGSSKHWKNKDNQLLFVKHINLYQTHCDYEALEEARRIIVVEYLTLMNYNNPISLMNSVLNKNR
jgi:hypothetical protein